MKKIFILCSILTLIATNGYTQQLLQNNEEVIKNWGTDSNFEIIKRNLKDKNSIKRLENAILSWNYKAFEPFLLSDIKEDIQKYFENFDKILSNNNLIKETHKGPFKLNMYWGNNGLKLEFNDLTTNTNSTENKISLDLKYYYYIKDSSLVLYQVDFNTNQKSQSKSIQAATIQRAFFLNEKLNKINWPENIVEVRKDIDELFGLKEELKNFNNFNETTFNETIVEHYQHLSWFLVLGQKYSEAIDVAEKTLHICKPESQNMMAWLLGGKALAYLLNGNDTYAREIYTSNKGLKNIRQENFGILFKHQLGIANERKLIKDDLYNEMLLFIGN